MVEAYWIVGQRILEEEQLSESRAKFGQKLLENLSLELSVSFGKGLSYANLRDFQAVLPRPTPTRRFATHCVEN